MSFLMIITACGSGGDGTTSGNDDQADQDIRVDAKDKDFAVPDAEKQLALQNFMSVSPGEVFQALDKMGNVAWAEIVAGSTTDSYTSDYAAALNIGVRVSDAMVAVNQENRGQVMSYWRSIEGLAGQLGYGDRLGPVEDSLKVNFVLGNWSRIRRTLDNMFNSMEGLAQAERPSRRDRELGVLVTGSFIEGVQILSNHFATNFNQEDVDLLNQGVTLGNYIQELEGLNMQDDLVKQVTAGIKQMQRIIGDGNKTFSAQDVTQLKTISGNLIKRITTA